MSHVGPTSPFLPLPDGIVIASVHPTASRLVVQVACCHSSVACPLCQQPSQRVHGAYVRTVQTCLVEAVTLSYLSWSANLSVGHPPAHARFSPNDFQTWSNRMLA